MQEFEGIIQFLDIAGGVWVLQADAICYQLFRAPAPLLQENLAVTITGRLLEDMLTNAQVGPVLEVLTFAIAQQ